MDNWNNIFEIFGALTGLLYIYLEIKQRRWMWIVGGLSAIVYIFVFFKAGLYAAMMFQTYYIGVSIYGWRRWGTGVEIASSDNAIYTADGEADVKSSDPAELSGKSALQMTVRMPFRTTIISIAAIILMTLFFWLILDRIDSDPMPFADALVVALSMVATYWVSNRYIEHWILWIVANSLSVYIYVSQQLYATMVLYIVFIIAAVVGYIEWRKFRRI